MLFQLTSVDFTYFFFADLNVLYSLTCYKSFRSLDSQRRLFSRYFLSPTLQAIGQAYEDMQTQNQRLLQEIIERDEYNAQVRIHVAL
jgi:hypothetical protein